MTTSDAARKALGRRAEDEAAALLRKAGMTILDRNWRKGRQEIDIVARDGDTLVFVEVRAKRRDAVVSPLESITPAKQRHMRTGALLWLADHRAWAEPCRFDVVAAWAEPDQTLTLEHRTDVL